MSNRKKQLSPQKPPIKLAAQMAVPPSIAHKEFHLPYPLLWLVLVPLLLYFPTFFYKLTDLDDTIFIRDFSAYNEDLHNLVVSFQRGVFDAVKDPYYRPLFLDSMILNYYLSGQDVMGYHIVNVLFHIVTVLLVYKLLRCLNIKQVYAFILALLFAVHPALSQAVAWIPGRNDTLLAIFTCSFLIFSVSYTKTQQVAHLAWSGVFLLLAYFTKETAVFAAPVALTLLIGVLKEKWLSRNSLIQYGLWSVCFLIWFIARANAIVQPDSKLTSSLFTDFIPRLPLIVQYLGKIFIPVNLSVFPIQKDTVNYYGITAILIVTVLLLLNRNRNMRIVWSGLVVFVLFLLPVLFVPNNLNQETFEHRLYLPFLGILLLLSQTILFQNQLTEKKLLAGGAVACALLAVINLLHQGDFSDPHTFWSSAAATSPHSAYANMMLGARVNNMEESSRLFRKAYQLNPKEKYLNFYYGVMLQKQDSVPQSEKYLLTEKNSSGYYECDFYLARVAAERKDYIAATGYLESYVKKDPGNNVAHSNLLLLYLQTRQRDKAVSEAKNMQQLGMPVPKEVKAQLGL